MQPAHVLRYSLRCATAIGADAYAAGYGSTALGSNAAALGDSGIAIGNTSVAGTYATAVGPFAVATGYASTAIGDTANATGDDSNRFFNSNETKSAADRFETLVCRPRRSSVTPRFTGFILNEAEPRVKTCA